MPVHEEKKARYADLAKRLAASKARAAARRCGENEGANEGANEELPLKGKNGKGNGAAAPAKPARRRTVIPQTTAPKKVGPKKLSKEQKKPKLTKETEVAVDPALRDMLDDTEVDPNTGLSMFQVALVERIRDKGELGVLDLCSMIWTKAEIVQAKNNPIGGQSIDLTRIVRNAIRSPKAAGIIAPSGNRGKYVFIEWCKAGKRKRK